MDGVPLLHICFHIPSLSFHTLLSEEKDKGGMGLQVVGEAGPQAAGDDAEDVSLHSSSQSPWSALRHRHRTIVSLNPKLGAKKRKKREDLRYESG
jgi:hypothetical protein